MDINDGNKIDGRVAVDDTNSPAQQTEKFLANLRSFIVRAKAADEREAQGIPSAEEEGDQANALANDYDIPSIDPLKYWFIGGSIVPGDRFKATINRPKGQVVSVHLETTGQDFKSNIRTAFIERPDPSKEDCLPYNARIAKVHQGSNIQELDREDFFAGPFQELGSDMLKDMDLSSAETQAINAARAALGGMTFIDIKSATTGPSLMLQGVHNTGTLESNLVKQISIPFLRCQKSKQQIVICCSNPMMAKNVGQDIDAVMKQQALLHPHVKDQYVVVLSTWPATPSNQPTEGPMFRQMQDLKFGPNGDVLYHAVLKNASVIVATPMDLAPKRVIEAITSTTTALVFVNNTAVKESDIQPIFSAKFEQDPKMFFTGDLEHRIH